MKVYIELLIIIAAILIFLVWLMWYKFSKRRLIKKYKPENDKGRKGTELGRSGERKSSVEESVGDSNGHGELERRELLSETNVDDGGKKVDTNGAVDSGNRKVRFFRRTPKG